MSDYLREIERLQHELQQAKAREERERREKEQAKAREERERREKEQAKAREEQERRKNQNTTLEEYLYNCHFHLYKKLGFSDPSKSSTGFTRVEGKYYPKWLCPWDNFANVHRQRHFEVIRTILGERRLFHRENTTRDLGSTISRNAAGNENAIDNFEKLAVEHPVWEILRPLWEEEELRGEYSCMGLRFSNNNRDFTQPNDSSPSREKDDPSEERHERRRRTGPNKRVASEQRVMPPPIKPDGWGVRTRLDESESVAFVYDYKAAHKIAIRYLRPAIAKEKLFMEVVERMNNNTTTRSDSELKEQERAEALIAMALTQVFDYMIRYGVVYGYVAAGQSLLFLYVDRTHPETLYCHPCIPGEEVGEMSTTDWPDMAPYTAVAQLASFCLLSLRSEALQGAALEAALQKAQRVLRKWSDPYEDAANLETHSPSAAASSSSQTTETTEGSNFVSSARPAGREFLLRSRSSCRDTTDVRRDEDEEDGPGDDVLPSWTKTDGSKRKEGPSSGSSEDGDATMSDSPPTRQYCTQACLLGLKKGGELDGSCPNVLAHRAAGGNNRHPIDADKFVRLMGERLRQNPYRGCIALDGWGKMGATGLLFKLELQPYSYTFVGKGTLSGRLHDLEHESRVYARLDRLQGEVVPVYLGLVRLDPGYILPGWARVVHMMLMSWGGEAVTTACIPNVEAEVRRSSQAVWAEGVDHGDERDANRLWNNERRRVMLVDFDRATLLPSPKHKQFPDLLGKKRKRSGPEFSSHTRKRGFLPRHLQSRREVT
ncbi:hypothetical protein SODALDRAFT_311485 [Sodiomyces alkalinus F11]|uniref:Protein kinase domain-containing protein n=1 Tax=Sodiomyces alkalinus (strain CBS 110278 / VKM F-3762 / F11) TaxID=1314773 RepID=A0A3N2PVW0_SODAK|nr:hypothetical protein SODALDRAFT_311485 [Sodiomyces alkalinus F11]ROT38612.1 hypothetical protein SODALDRAFT_311485 [Sodiomyces alkalinus F11]